jgi:hypothetical protein
MITTVQSKHPRDFIKGIYFLIKKFFSQILFYFYTFFNVFQCLEGCSTTVGSNDSAGDHLPLETKN